MVGAPNSLAEKIEKKKGSPGPIVALTSPAATDKQGSRLVRWPAVESVQVLPKSSAVGQLRERIAARRGRYIGVVAAARRQLEHVFYALRDYHVRALSRHPKQAPA
jgi:hypothetical protein